MRHGASKVTSLDQVVALLKDGDWMSYPHYYREGDHCLKLIVDHFRAYSDMREAETRLDFAAAAQLAPLVDYVDLDGHLLLADDPFEGIGGSEGVLTLNDHPGLGVRERPH